MSSVSSADPYPLFTVFSFIGFVLVLIPLPWHLQSWNAGTCLYMIWAAVACLNQFVNSIIWRDNAINWAPVWCDISSRIIIGTSVAIPAASLCINRRLYKLASLQVSQISRAQKRRAVAEDLAIGLGIPIIQIAVAYVVQGHRFDIYEEIGCYPAIYNVWLTYALTLTWPIVIGLVSAVYCTLTLRAFWKRQAEFQILLAANTSMNLHRYFRLMALASTEVLCTTPIACYFLYLNTTGDSIHPYRGWADLHYNWSFVGQFPSVLWRSSPSSVIALEMTRWLVVACALVFFLFFGFAAEARRQYCLAFWAICKPFGIRPRPKNVMVNRLAPVPMSRKKQESLVIPELTSTNARRNSLFSIYGSETETSDANKSNESSSVVLSSIEIGSEKYHTV